MGETKTALGTGGAPTRKLGTVGGKNNVEALEKTQNALGEFPNDTQFDITIVMQACGFDLPTARRLCRNCDPKWVRQKVRWALEHVRNDGNLAGLVWSLLEKSKGTKR